MDLLQPVVFEDAWGSRTAIAELQGRSTPSEGPESELWMGAHESAPSGLVRGPTATTLQDVVAENPHGELGTAVVERFGGRFPFLLKVLAPQRAISIQAHPTQLQALEARRAGSVAYVDDWPKPELLAAITEFEVLVGTRAWSDIRDVTAGLGVGRLTEAVDDAEARQRDDAARTRALLRTLFDLEPREKVTLAREVVAAAAARGGDTHRDTYDALVRISADHPDDIGLVVMLTMNRRVLQPGQYVFVPTGALHAYVHGVGVEVLANSDNVVRAGLTGKPVDVEELLRIADLTASMPAREPAVHDEGVLHYAADTDYFRLYRLVGGQVRTLAAQGHPRIVFAPQGAELGCGDERLALGLAGSAFVSATEGDLRVRSDGDVWVATVNLP